MLRCALLLLLLPALAPAQSPDGSARGDTASFWMSEEASADSLDHFWQTLADEWQAEVPEPIAGFGLQEFEVDSLRAIGELKIDEMVAGTLWRSHLHWLQLPEFNRAQGPVVRFGWTLQKVGPNHPVYRMQAGYSFGNQRPVAAAELTWPLIKRRWRLRGDLGQGREYTLLNLELSARLGGKRFAGDGRRFTRSFSSLIYGSDPNHYFETRNVRARLVAQLGRESSIWLAGGMDQERPLGQQVRWNVFGQDPSPNGIRRAEGMDTKRLSVGADLQWGPLRMQGTAAWWRAENAAFLDRLAGVSRSAPGEGIVDYLDLRLDARYRGIDPLGNQWVVSARHRQADKPLPRQHRYWLGDYNDTRGMLRGYEAGELSGDIAHSASIDVGLNFDLWRTLRIPVLKNLGMQPLLFADWGRTRNVDHHGRDYFDVASPDPLGLELGEGAQDWRANVGFGFSVPGLEPVSRMRISAARPVGEGAGAKDWRILFAFER